MVPVQRDTATVLAVSPATYYHRTAVGYVEAGLRTKDEYAPFPRKASAGSWQRGVVASWSPDS